MSCTLMGFSLSMSRMAILTWSERAFTSSSLNTWGILILCTSPLYFSPVKKFIYHYKPICSGWPEMTENQEQRTRVRERLKIIGMHCATCAVTIEKTSKQLLTPSAYRSRIL